MASTVESYLRMLKLELAVQPYNKAEENRKLRAHLDGRSQAAVEFKHQNISAVLIELGWIPISGYKPASNYQRIRAAVGAVSDAAHRVSGRWPPAPAA